MPHVQRTIKPSRANLIQGLKDDVGPEALRTLDPETSISHGLPPVPGSSTAKLESYPCTSQKPTPTVITGSTSAAALQVGYGGKIPRWKTGPGKTINYAVLKEGYPKPELASLAATKLHEAANEWNKLDLGVQFHWVSELEDAAFVLTYANSIGTSTLAEAFFPNDLDLNYLNVYSAAFKPGAVQFLKNIFLHELGHVLGLRHEFAPEMESGGTNLKSVQIGPRDPTSVMAYEFPPQIQDTDIKSTQAFYRFPGERLGVYQRGVDQPLRIVDFDANN
ncbi:hypothetical protein BDV12DRAFT_176478 [Aspergillus spectabilis]